MKPVALKDLLPFWPNCATPDCQNKACVRLQSKFCDPCTHRLGAQGSAPADYFSSLRSHSKAR